MLWLRQDCISFKICYLNISSDKTLIINVFDQKQEQNLHVTTEQYWCQLNIFLFAFIAVFYTKCHFNFFDSSTKEILSAFWSFLRSSSFSGFKLWSVVKLFEESEDRFGVNRKTSSASVFFEFCTVAISLHDVVMWLKTLFSPYKICKPAKIISCSKSQIRQPIVPIKGYYG